MKKEIRPGSFSRSRASGTYLNRLRFRASWILSFVRGLDLLQHHFNHLLFQKRGVAGGEEGERAAGMEKPRVNAGQGAPRLEDVCDDQGVPLQKVERLVCHNYDFIEELREHPKEPVDDPDPADLEKGLVLPPVAGAEASGEDYARTRMGHIPLVRFAAARCGSGWRPP